MFVLNTNFLLNIKLHNIEIILAMNVAMLILKNALLKFENKSNKIQQKTISISEHSKEVDKNFVTWPKSTLPILLLSSNT